MKKKALIIVLPTLIAYFSNAQCDRNSSITVGIESGYSFGHAPVAGFNAGVNFATWNIRAGMLAHLTNKVSDGMLPFIKIGHTFDLGDIYVTAAAGYAYSFKSADKLRMNSNMILVSPEIGYKFTATYYNGETPMAVYLLFTQTYGKETQFKDYSIISAGVRAYF